MSWDPRREGGEAADAEEELESASASIGVGGSLMADIDTAESLRNSSGGRFKGCELRS